MEGDIENYSPTVMFRGTPCIWFCYKANSFVSINLNKSLIKLNASIHIGQFLRVLCSLDCLKSINLSLKVFFLFRSFLVISVLDNLFYVLCSLLEKSKIE